MTASEAVVVDEASDALIINDRFRRSPTGPQAQREAPWRVSTFLRAAGWKPNAGPPSGPTTLI